MRFFVVPGFVLLTIISLVSAQPNKQSKKSDTPTILTTAQFVFVEPYLGPNNEGSIYDSNVSAEDRDAVTNVLEALEKWGYYKKAIRRSDADLVIFVRTGLVSHPYNSVHVQTGRQSPDAPSPKETAAGARNGVENGPSDDLFWVYWRNTDGKLNGPIWQESLKNGLATPKLVLFQNFKDEVTRKAAEQAKKKAPPQSNP
jgi:hypothetical protein